MTFDPYAELGVPRDAGPEQIKKAHRKRAKRTHPDGGGDPDAFVRTQRALAVLSDPGKRKVFDETGRLEEDKADNERATALQIIEAFINGVIDAHFQGKAVDPRCRDLFNEFRIAAENEIEQATAGMAQGRQVKAFLEDLAGRVKGSDPARPIERMLERRIHYVADQLKKAEDSIAARKLAIEIAARYSMASAYTVTVTVRS